MDNRQFRDALGQFATGICVVATARDGAPPVGMTINSFSSVSLEPPLILWSIQNSAECFPSFIQASHFSVNILSLQQEDLSVYYAQRGAQAMPSEHFALGSTGSPLIRGALANFECKSWARYPGGDHQIIVGEVLKMQARPNGKPLLYHQGRYAEIR